MQLQQTPFLTLLPDQRIQRTLRLMQRTPDEPVTGARRARGLPARRRQGDRRRIDRAARLELRHRARRAQLPDRRAARAAAGAGDAQGRRAQGQLGAAVTALRKRLGESLASIQKYDVPVTDATTTSLEALRAYGQGVRDARHARRRGVDSVLPAGHREGSELRARLRQARRRHSATSAARRGASRTRQGLRAARQGQRIRAALHPLDLLHAGGSKRGQAAQQHGIARSRETRRDARLRPRRRRQVRRRDRPRCRASSATTCGRRPTYFTLGQIQERAGRTDDAIASYRRLVDAAPALAMNTTLPFGRLALARLLAAKGDTAGANVQIEILKKQWARADAEFLPAKELRKLSR